jgi:DNA-binding NarL/FixJ family response regulator
MRTLICDDHAVVRETLASLLEAAGHEVVGCFGEVAPAVELGRRGQAEATVMDLMIPGQDVDGAIAQLAHLGVRVIAISGDHTTEPRARRAGATGWVCKSSPAQDLLDLLGDHPRSERDVPAPIRRRHDVDQHLVNGRCRLLTSRERDVLIELAQGGGTREVAARLGLRESTVRSYAQSILTKLGVRSRLAAVAVAVREGLIPSSPLQVVVNL